MGTESEFPELQEFNIIHSRNRAEQVLREYLGYEEILYIETELHCRYELEVWMIKKSEDHWCWAQFSGMHLVIFPEVTKAPDGLTAFYILEAKDHLTILKETQVKLKEAGEDLNDLMMKIREVIPAFTLEDLRRD